MNVPLWSCLGTTLVALLVFIGVTRGWLPDAGLSRWERRSVDLRFLLRGPMAPSDDRVVVVGLDTRLRRERPADWQTRRGFVSLLERLAAHEPRAIGVDVFFSDPELPMKTETLAAVRDASQSLSTYLKATPDAPPPVVLAQSALARVVDDTNGDSLFAEVVTAHPRMVLALLFDLGGDLRASPVDSPALQRSRLDEYVIVDQPVSIRAPRASAAVLPLSEIAQAVPHTGHVNLIEDADGTVREMPLVIQYGEHLHSSLALKLAALERGASATHVLGDRHVQLGQQRLPTSPRGIALINHLGPAGTFPHVSAADVVSGTVDPAELKDKIVLVGYTDVARDRVTTPFDQQLAGVELHASVLENLRTGTLLRKTRPWVTAVSILLMGSLICISQLRRLRRSKAPWLLCALAVSTFGYLLFVQLAFARGLVVPLVVPLIAVGAIALTALLSALATEGREKQQIRSAFGQYLQASLIERVLRDPSQLRLGGERRELTVLFSDIRGFTRISESLDPDILSSFLNEYLTPMTDLVLRKDGTLDKYIGDAVMAIYGAPVEFSDHASRACDTALEMMDSLRPLNEHWRKRGLPEVRVGIGINTGTMSVGNMGSQSRFDYTVMGDAVNLGARLESLTKEYDVAILAGEATQQAAKATHVFREIDSVRVVGRTAPARVYQLVGRIGEETVASELCAEYAAGLAAYRAREWQQAIAHFQTCLTIDASDGPSETLLSRAQAMRIHPPSDAWDGTFAQTKK